MEYKELILEKNDGIATVTINRKEKGNCWTMQLYQEFEQVQKELHDDDSIRVIVLTGAGNTAFCGGIDISLLGMGNPEFVGKLLPWLQSVNTGWETHSKPVIAAINGSSIGGGVELALACDIRVASDKARFALPEVRVGLSPDMGGTQRLTKIIGPSQAKRFALTGVSIDAAEAARIGLVDVVVPADQVMEEALKMARKITYNAPLAVKYAKKAINLATESSMAVGMLYEELASTFCFGTEDKNEALQSFIEKRPPVYKSK